MSRTLQEWLSLLEQRHPKEIDMGLARVSAVRDRMGLQYDCPVIMVGGTNGKGSTCAMLESILLQAGYRVGLYSKPVFQLTRLPLEFRLVGTRVPTGRVGLLVAVDNDAAL